MITLTNPVAVNSVLGTTATNVNYEKLVLAPLTFDAVGQVISGTCRLTSTSTPAAPPIMGSFVASVPAGDFVLRLDQGHHVAKRLLLTGPQAAAITANIETAQAAIENGLISLGVVAGTRSAGA